MSDIIIDVDEPEVVISDEYSTDYNLPIASSTTLGGVKIGANIAIASDGKISIPYASAHTAGVVKVGTNLSIDENGVLSADGGGSSITVDSVLSTASTNPVQNRVITNALNSATSDISSLQEDVSSIGGRITDVEDSVTNLGSTVSTNTGNISSLQAAVETNTDNIATNAGNISTLDGTVSSLSGRVTTAESTISNHTSAIAQLQGYVNPLIVTFDEVINATSLTTASWTTGSLTIRRRGNVGVLNINISGGSGTIAANSSFVVYAMSDATHLPATNASAILYKDGDVLYSEFTNEGKLIVYNDTSSSISLDKLSGQISLIFI